MRVRQWCTLHTCDLETTLLFERGESRLSTTPPTGYLVNVLELTNVGGATQAQDSGQIITKNTSIRRIQGTRHESLDADHVRVTAHGERCIWAQARLRPASVDAASDEETSNKPGVKNAPTHRRIKARANPTVQPRRPGSC